MTNDALEAALPAPALFALALADLLSAAIDNLELGRLDAALEQLDSAQALVEVAVEHKLDAPEIELGADVIAALAVAGQLLGASC